MRPMMLKTLSVLKRGWRPASFKHCFAFFEILEATSPNVTSARGMPGGTPVEGIVTLFDPSIGAHMPRDSIESVLGKCDGATPHSSSLAASVAMSSASSGVNPISITAPWIHSRALLESKARAALVES